MRVYFSKRKSRILNLLGTDVGLTGYIDFILRAPLSLTRIYSTFIFVCACQHVRLIGQPTHSRQREPFHEQFRFPSTATIAESTSPPVPSWNVTVTRLWQLVGGDMNLLFSKLNWPTFLMLKYHQEEKPLLFYLTFGDTQYNSPKLWKNTGSPVYRRQFQFIIIRSVCTVDNDRFILIFWLSVTAKLCKSHTNKYISPTFS